MIVIPTAKVINAMAIIQSSLELADRAQRRVFVVSIVFGVVAALIAAFLAWLVWNANNKYQDAVKADADARIAEAGTRAATANAEAAKANEGLGKSNAEIARLTNEAEQAKTERAEADKQIAIAKADAARAKEGIANAEARSLEASAEVARLHVTVANAEKSRAEAQAALLSLQEKVEPRRLTVQQRGVLLSQLSATKFKGSVEIQVPVGEVEAYSFALEISDVLRNAGWTPEINNRVMIIGGSGPPTGLILKVRVEKGAPDHAVPLGQALLDAGLPLTAELDPSLPADKVVLLVGSKKP